MSDLTAKPETTNALRPGGRQARVMAQSLALVEESGPALARKTLAAAGLGFLALLAWAGFIEIDDATKVFGQVIPAGDAETVLHPDGGTISEILVSEGEVVEQGQILIRFDAGEAKAELEQMQTRRAEVGLMAAAFRALSSGGEPDFSFVSSVYQPQAENEKLIFVNLKLSMEKRRNVLSARAVNMQEKLGNIAEQEKVLAKKASLLEDELELRQDLYKKGQAAKKVYLEAKRDVDKTHRDLADLAESRKLTAESLAEAQNRSSELETRLKEKALDDFGVVAGRLDGINESLEKIKNRLSSLEIQAPAKGVVRSVSKHTLGSIIEPGSVVIEIIPLGGDAAIEARIAVKDIDRVGIGQPVTVTVKAPGFSRYGGITGKLTEISSSTLNDGRGKPYYRGIVAMDRNFAGAGPEKLTLMPGMKVEVKIKTGSKRLFQHLWN